MSECLYKVTNPSNSVLHEVYDFKGSFVPTTIEDIRRHGVCLAWRSNGWVDIPSRKPSKRAAEFEALPFFRAPLL